MDSAEFKEEIYKKKNDEIYKLINVELEKNKDLYKKKYVPNTLFIKST